MEHTNFIVLCFVPHWVSIFQSFSDPDWLYWLHTFYGIPNQVVKRVMCALTGISLIYVHSRVFNIIYDWNIGKDIPYTLLIQLCYLGLEKS